MGKAKSTIWRSAAVPAVVLVLAGCAHTVAKPAPEVQRYGSVIGLNADKVEEYKKLHANAWPGVLDMITQCNIRNYSIYLVELKEGEYYLFSYFEYVGDDFEADMAKMAEDPTTQEWWTHCEPCQQPIPLRAEGEWWANMEEVFHHD